MPFVPATRRGIMNRERNAAVALGKYEKKLYESMMKATNRAYKCSTSNGWEDTMLYFHSMDKLDVSYKGCNVPQQNSIIFLYIREP